MKGKKQRVKNPNRIRPHTLPAPHGLKKVGVVMDVGCGIRPMQWFTPVHHICVDPYLPYCEVLEEAGFKEVHCLVAAVALQPGVFAEVEAVYLLDVIEHMEKADALRVIRMAQKVATVQVVIYTPYGFMEQTQDNWGLGGHSWQTHRSGWLPEEFHAMGGWVTQLFRPEKKPNPQGFYAIWDRRSIAN